MKHLHFLLTILLISFTFSVWADDEDTVIVTVDGLNYNLLGRNEAHPFAALTDITPNGDIIKYSGDLTVPYNFEYDGKIFIVNGIDNGERIFTDVPGLTSLTFHCWSDVEVKNAPLLKSINCEMSSVGTVSNCPNLKTIRLSKNVTYVNSDVIDCPELEGIYVLNEGSCTLNDIFGNVNLPLDIYFDAEGFIRPDEYRYSDWYFGYTNPKFTPNPNVTFHVKEGMKDVFESSAWEGWNIVEDRGQFRDKIEFSYSGHGYGNGGGYAVGVGDNNAELAFRIPADLAKEYAGGRIVSINFNSIGVHWNEINGETYDYVFITEPDKDYVIKKDIKTIRGIFNRIELDEAYTITGETEILVGFGSHSVIEWGTSRDVEQTKDGLLFRVMGNNYCPMYECGNWYTGFNGDEYGTFNCECTIEGCDIKKDIKLHSLKIGRNDLTVTNPDDELKKEWENGRSFVKKIIHIDAGKPIDLSFIVHSNTPGVIHSLLFSYDIDGVKKGEKLIDTLLPNNTATEMSFSIPPLETAGEHEITIRCTGIDEGEDRLPHNSTSAKSTFVRDVEKTFIRNSLIETVCNDNNLDTTRDRLESQLPDNNIIVSVHVWDDLAPSYNYYDGVLENNGQLRPVVNREFSSAFWHLLELKDEERAPAEIKIKDLYFTDSDKTRIKVETEAEFGFDTVEKFNISYLVVEDDVKFGNNIHNGLVRGCFGSFNGVSLSDDESGFKKGVKYPADYSFNISGLPIDDIEKLRIVAVLIDDEYHTVVNAAVAPIHEVKLPQFQEGMRKIVIECATATNCGWCPREMAALDELKMDFPDNVLPIAVHVDGWGDPMDGAIGYSRLLDQIWSLPGCMVDRTQTLDPSPENLREYVEQNYLDADARIEIAHSALEPNDEVRVTSVISDYGKLVGNYHIAYALTEDNVGPYIQWNSYAGGDYGPMGGYENKPEIFECVYDNVARLVYNNDGEEGTFLARSLSADNSIFSTRFSVPENVTDKNNLKITAMLIKTDSGQIVNASRAPINYQTSEVEEVSVEDKCEVRQIKDELEVTASAGSHIQLYTSQGHLLEHRISSGSTIRLTLPHCGIYLLKVSSESYKIIL